MTIGTDSFTRANNSGDLGTDWTTVPGETLIELLSNKASCHGDVADQAEYWNVFTPTNDQYSKAKLTATAGYTTGDGPGQAVRMATGAVTYYRLICSHQASNNINLGKKVTGAFTSVTTVTQAWTDADTWELRVVGTSLTAYLNGTIVSGLTTTDSAIASGRVGLAYSSENSGQTGTWDDWEGGDYGAAGPQDTPSCTDVRIEPGVRCTTVGDIGGSSWLSHYGSRRGERYGRYWRRSPGGQTAAAATTAAGIVKVKRLEISQSGTATLAMIRGELATRTTAGTLTMTSTTPQNISPVGGGSGLTGNTAPAGGAARTATNSSADSGGTYTSIMSFNFANTAGYLFKPDPEEEIYVPPAVLFVVRLLATPATTTGWTFSLILGENV